MPHLREPGRVDPAVEARQPEEALGLVAAGLARTGGRLERRRQLAPHDPRLRAHPRVRVRGLDPLGPQDPAAIAVVGRPRSPVHLVVAVDRARELGGTCREAALVVPVAERVRGGGRRAHRQERGPDAVHGRLPRARLEVVLAGGRRLEAGARVAERDQEPGRAPDRRIDPLEVSAARRRRALVVAPQGP